MRKFSRLFTLVAVIGLLMSSSAYSAMEAVAICDLNARQKTFVILEEKETHQDAAPSHAILVHLSSGPHSYLINRAVEASFRADIIDPKLLELNAKFTVTIDGFKIETELVAVLDPSNGMKGGGTATLTTQLGTRRYPIDCKTRTNVRFSI